MVIAAFESIAALNVKSLQSALQNSYLKKGYIFSEAIS